MGGVVVHGLLGLDQAGRIRRGLTRVRVAVEAREVAARHVQAEPVAGLEDVAGGPEVDGVGIGAPGLDLFRGFARAAVACDQRSAAAASKERAREVTFMGWNFLSEEELDRRFTPVRLRGPISDSPICRQKI